jgi:hypothetical protein
LLKPTAAPTWLRNTLFRSYIGECVANLLAKFHPQLLIIDAVCWGNAIKNIAITFHIEPLSLLQDPIINSRPSHEREGKGGLGVSILYDCCILIDHSIQGELLHKLL